MYQYGCPASIVVYEFLACRVQDHFEGAAGAAVIAGAAWNSFIELKSVLYMPHPSGIPTSSHASRIIPADDFLTPSVISIPPGLRLRFRHPVFLIHRTNQEISHEPDDQQGSHHVQHRLIRARLVCSVRDFILPHIVHKDRTENAGH